MRPRQYSISSSPLSTSGSDVNSGTRATLTYSILEGPALANPANRYIGVATAYLASLQPGDRLHLSVRPTHTAFRLPENDDTPMMCVAAGSGLAPFRGFVQERAARQANGEGKAAPAPMLLFYGCRRPQLDDIYRDEFDAWQERGLVDVRRAFSRVADGEETEAQGCKHVQDRLWHDRDEVKALWERGARVYVCGSRAVGEEVKRTLGRVVLGETAGEGEVAKWYQKVRNNRFATDVFD